jgi:hypothetical protein
MIKTWQFRGFALYLTLGIPLAASCAKEANTLDGDASSAGTSTSGKGSVTSTAGTFGKAGTTGSNPFGGTATTGGKPGSAGSAAEGGDTTGEAGSGSTIPPEVLASAKAVVYYETTHTIASDKVIQMKLHIVNQSDNPLPMAKVKIRYWFTPDGAAPTLHQYYTGPQAQDPAAMFVDDAANSHVLMTFGAGSVVKGGDLNASEIQLEIDSTTTAFNQEDDYSWQPTSTTSKPNAKITLYLDDTLIWGCEPPPGGQCFEESGAGGAGGAAGAGGQDAGVGGQGVIAGAGGQGAGGAP